MRSADKSPGRSRWPVILLSAALILLAGAAVATAHLYWTDLRNGVRQMRASMAAAQQQQRQLVERVRIAEAALAQRAAALEPVEDGARRSAEHDALSRPPTPQPDEASAKPVPPEVQRLRDALSPDERVKLAVWLEGLARRTARLPPVWAATPTPSTITPLKPLLRNQLEIAVAAAQAGDVVLLDAALLAAQRLAAGPRRGADEPGTAMTEQLAAVRQRLRAP